MGHRRLRSRGQSALDTGHPPEGANRSIPNAEFHRMEGAWHLLWVDDGAEEMVQTQVEFAKAHFDKT